jgi:hypothetical protein
MGPHGFGVDPEVLASVAEEVAAAAQAGVRIAIVVSLFRTSQWPNHQTYTFIGVLYESVFLVLLFCESTGSANTVPSLQPLHNCATEVAMSTLCIGILASSKKHALRELVLPRQAVPVNPEEP